MDGPAREWSAGSNLADGAIVPLSRNRIQVYRSTPSCDDNESTINTGAFEIPYNGLDENCDGLADDDLDHDGFGHWTNRVVCNDCDPAIKLAAPEILDSGVDEYYNSMADDSSTLRPLNAIEAPWGFITAPMQIRSDPGATNGTDIQTSTTDAGTGAYNVPVFSPYTVGLHAGGHSLVLRGRENNAKLDYFYPVKIADLKRMEATDSAPKAPMVVVSDLEATNGTDIFSIRINYGPELIWDLNPTGHPADSGPGGMTESPTTGPAPSAHSSTIRTSCSSTRGSIHSPSAVTSRVEAGQLHLLTRITQRLLEGGCHGGRLGSQPKC